MVSVTYKSGDTTNGPFCSKKCCRLNSKENVPIVKCTTCSKSFTRNKSNLRERNFCSQSCSAKYTNTHRKTGTRRSKLEAFLEERLKIRYPNLGMDFNQKTAIESELDIYIPSLKLAFELNGIFHYEPIYGDDKLQRIQNNDTRKFQACIERGIELCIIDSSKQKYFKEESSLKFLEIIMKIIDNKCGRR